VADDQTPTSEDLEAQRRGTAQDAAGDLARMGIDPRLLGLDAPHQQRRARPYSPEELAAASVPTVPDQAPTESDDASVPAQIVPLRPEFAPAVPTAWPSDRSSGARSPQVYGPVEQLLARTATDRPTPSQAGRWVKAVTFGLLTPDAAEAAGNERLLVTALRTRQSDRRVVTFSAGKGGVGTTTVALAVGSALAALREDETVLVDAQAGTPALSALLGLDGAPRARDLARPSFDRHPAVAPGGLRVVDGSGWGTPLRRGDVAVLLDRLKADHAFVLVDLGNDAGDAGHALLARSDQAVIVTGPGAAGLAAARVAGDRVEQLDPGTAARALHVIVCAHAESYRRVRKEVEQQRTSGPVRAVVVPPDPLLALGQPFDPGGLRPATREAMLQIAAAVAVSGGVVR